MAMADRLVPRYIPEALNERGTMGKPLIAFRCPDLPQVLGGVRQTYRHVDVLNENGFDAVVVHRKKGFKPKWFAHQTHVTYEPLTLGKSDIAVYPEIWGPAITQEHPKIRKAVLNQNSYYSFVANPLRKRLVVPYTSPQVIATIVVSEDSKKYLQHVFPKMPVHRIRYSIDPNLYCPEQKIRQICVMPRKNEADVKQVLHILNLRGALKGWKVVLVDGFSEAKAAAVMRESAVFLSFAGLEGFGLPSCEALQCRCIVCGYTGFAGEEFMSPEWCFPIPMHNILEFAQTAERILRDYENSPHIFAPMTEKAAAFVKENYSRDRERETITSAWAKILQI